MPNLRAVFGAARQRGLDETNLRALAARITGSDSLKGHSAQTYRQIINAMGPTKERLHGPQLGKIHALWIAAHNLCVIDNKSDEALTAFVKRTVGIDHFAWLANPKDANKVVEGIKAMIGRSYSIDWSDPSCPPQQHVAKAIFTRLSSLRMDAAAEFASAAQDITGLALADFENSDWITFQNVLGKQLRDALRTRTMETQS